MMNVVLLLVSGMTAGILASAHCVLMCGSIAIVVAQQPFGLWPHLLRISVYCLLAVIAMYVLIPIVDVPRWWLGVGLISAALMSWYSKSRACAGCPSSDQSNSSIKKTSQLQGSGLKFAKPIAWLWGFLPCPMVFMMISTSIALDSVFEAVIFMGSFGLGTLPALLSVSYGSKWFVGRAAFHKQWLEVGLVGLGIWSLAVGFLPVHDIVHGGAHGGAHDGAHGETHGEVHEQHHH